MPTDDRCDPRAYERVTAQMFDRLAPDELGRLYCNAQQVSSDIFARFAATIIVTRRFDVIYLSPGSLDLVARVCAIEFAGTIARFRGECRFSSYAKWTVLTVCRENSPYVQQRHLPFDPGRHQSAHSVTQRPADDQTIFDSNWLKEVSPRLRRVLAALARRRQRSTREEAAGLVPPISAKVKLLLFIAYKLNHITLADLAQRLDLPVAFIQKLINNFTANLADAIRRAYEDDHPGESDATDEQLFRWLITGAEDDDDDDDDENPPAAGVPVPGGHPR